MPPSEVGSPTLLITGPGFHIFDFLVSFGLKAWLFSCGPGGFFSSSLGYVVTDCVRIRCPVCVSVYTETAELIPPV